MSKVPLFDCWSAVKKDVKSVNHAKIVKQFQKLTIVVLNYQLFAIFVANQPEGRSTGDCPKHYTMHMLRNDQRSFREFFVDNLLVRVHCIIEMIWWTGLAPWELECPFLGSLISTFLKRIFRVAKKFSAHSFIGE